jgi:hypothetical protein
MAQGRAHLPLRRDYRIIGRLGCGTVEVLGTDESTEENEVLDRRRPDPRSRHGSRPREGRAEAEGQGTKVDTTGQRVQRQEEGMTKPRVKGGFVLCDNCDTPASATYSALAGWVGCAACILGEADAIDPDDFMRGESETMRDLRGVLGEALEEYSR